MTFLNAGPLNMLVKIVGSAAGGGFPQWNCNYRLSRAARAGAPGVQARTQSSIAVSADGRGWVLFNASPDIRQQIASTPDLQPDAAGPLRDSPIRAVVLTNADVDHIAGLLSLRERQPFALYGSARVLDVLAANPVFNVLDPAIVLRRVLPEGTRIAILDAADQSLGIDVETFSVPGKIPLYLEDAARDPATYASDAGDTVAARISAEGSGVLYYVPGCARVERQLREKLAGADCLLFDGTVYTDDEMVTAGVGSKTGGRMGHIAMSGSEGSIARLAGVDIGRRIYVHINNTNPVLDDASPERAAVTAAGWEVAHDGMEIVL